MCLDELHAHIIVFQSLILSSSLASLLLKCIEECTKGFDLNLLCLLSLVSEERGWAGLASEPQRAAIKLFSEHRVVPLCEESRLDMLGNWFVIFISKRKQVCRSRSGKKNKLEENSEKCLHFSHLLKI